MIDLGQSTDNILVSGHRGICALYPENTMVSFRAAVEAGVDNIEMDLNVTRDGQLVVIHDTTVDRTTDCVGKVRSFTLDEIKSMDAGSRFDNKFAGERIPTFEEFLKLVATTGISLNVELKDYTFECADKAVALLLKYGFDGRFVVTSFDANITQYVHQVLGFPTQGFPLSKMANASNDTNKHLSAVGMGSRWIDEEPSAAEYRALGIDYWTWCPDTEEEVLRHIAAGASLMTCNNPFPALKVLKERGLHK